MKVRQPHYDIEIQGDEWVVIDLRSSLVVYRSDTLSEVLEWLYSREDFP